MDFATSYRKIATLSVCSDVRFIWLMLIAAVAECTGLERAALQLPNYSSGYYPQHFVLIDPWVSPSSKNVTPGHDTIARGPYQRTTNGAAESFHSTYNAQFNSDHPPIFVVITTLMETQAETVTKLLTISKDTKSAVYKKNNGKLDESMGGIKEVDAEKYKGGKLMDEEKSTKYKEEKGDDNKYNDKGGDAGEIHTHRGKKKEASYKKGDKQKKFKTKKGFRDNYHKNEKHKVNEFWDNYETYGTFKKFGKKGDKKLLGNKKVKKNKTKKGGQSNKENSNKGETKHKSGKKGEMGHNKEKHSDTHYNNESKYHKEKKSKKHHKKNT